MLLFRYLKKVKTPLMLASFVSLYFLLFSLLEIFPILILLTWISLGSIVAISVSNILTRFYPNSPLLRNRAVSIKLVLGLVGGLVLTIFAFPHVFLFLNALPFFVSSTLIALSTFIANFELMIRVVRGPRRRPPLGKDYSLINILLNPFSSIEKLRPLLIPELRLELIKLPQTQQDALRARQEKALQELKKHPGAIIDDLALYNKHKTILFAGKTPAQLAAKTPGVTLVGRNNHQNVTIQTQGPTLEQKLNTQTMDNTTKEAATLEETFTKDLSSAQKEAYKEYRRLTTELNSPHATCLYAGSDLLDTAAKDFVVLEKRVLDASTTRSSEGKTYFMHHANGFSRLLDMSTGYGVFAEDVEAFNPVDRERLFSPDSNLNYPGKTTEYKYHPYTVVEGHGLSLQLCEVIEALNLSLKPALNQQRRTTPVSTVSSTNNLSANIENYRNTLPANGVSVINHSVFPQGTVATSTNPPTQEHRHSPSNL